jgi:hypothetical protein
MKTGRENPVPTDTVYRINRLYIVLSRKNRKHGKTEKPGKNGNRKHGKTGKTRQKRERIR